MTNNHGSNLDLIRVVEYGLHFPAICELWHVVLGVMYDPCAKSWWFWLTFNADKDNSNVNVN